MRQDCAERRKLTLRCNVCLGSCQDLESNKLPLWLWEVKDSYRVLVRIKTSPLRAINQEHAEHAAAETRCFPLSNSDIHKDGRPQEEDPWRSPGLWSPLGLWSFSSWGKDAERPLESTALSTMWAHLGRGLQTTTQTDRECACVLSWSNKRSHEACW